MERIAELREHETDRQVTVVFCPKCEKVIGESRTYDRAHGIAREHDWSHSTVTYR